MVKLISLPIIYCIGFFIVSFSSDVNGTRSSISVAVPSGSVIENSKSFSHVRAKRALALLVPFDDDDESSEEHHKSKRCWRARPVQKMGLSTEPGDEIEKDLAGPESGSTQGAKNNSNKLYDGKKRSVEKSQEASYESRESLEDNLARKIPYLRIVPLKNSRKNVKQFLATEREIKDNEAVSHESEEDSEDLILKRIKSHLNSDDYNVLALVGKRANHPKSNSQQKYICYCRQADCTGGDCQRMMYRPCSTCRNSRPIYIGKGDSRRFSYEGRNDYRNQEGQSTDARVPLKIRYPATKNEFIQHPVNNDVELGESRGISSSMNFNKFDRKNYQQNLPVAQDRRYQFSDGISRGVLANQDDYLKPLDQHRILHIPMSAKSAMKSEISSSKIAGNAHPPVLGKPVAIEYRSQSAKFAPDRSAYNQWYSNSYYPSIGNSGNSNTQNKDHGVNRQDFNTLYQNNNGFAGPKIQFPNQGNLAFSQPAAIPAGYQVRQDFGTTGPKIRTNLLPISNNLFYNKYYDADGLRWNMPSGIMHRAQIHPLQQNILTQPRTVNYQGKSSSSSAQKDSDFDLEARGYGASTENNFVSSSNLDADSYESDGNDSEDTTEEQFSDSQSSIGHNLGHTEDQRNVNYLGASDEPEKYGIPLIHSEKVNPSTNQAIIGIEGSDYDHDMDFSTDETTFGTQLEEPRSEQSDWDTYNDDTTHQAIIRPDSNEETSSTYNDQFETSESSEDLQLVRAEPGQPDVEKSERVLISEENKSEKSTGYDDSDIQVITNGYFTSKAYDDFGETNNDGKILVAEIGTSHDPDSNEGKSYSLSSKAHMESGLENEDVAMAVDEMTTDDYIGDKNFGSSYSQESAREELDESSIEAKNQFLESNMREIVPVTDVSFSEDISSTEYRTGAEIQPIKSFNDNNKVIDVVKSSISSTGDSEHLQDSGEIEYSSVGSAESSELNMGSSHMKSDEVIGSLKKTGTFLTESVRDQRTDSAEYESGKSDAGDYYETDSSMEENTPIVNEKDAREAAGHSPSILEDEDNSGELSRLKSIESFEDNSNSGDDFTGYSFEDSHAVSSEKKFESPGDEILGIENDDDAEEREPADVGIENLPTKYFSPNDRVLEYIKKYGQNLAGHYDPVNDQQLRTQATPIYPSTAGQETRYVSPDIYHIKPSRDESAEHDVQGSDYGSESEEIITQPSVLHHRNSNYETTEYQAVKYSTEGGGDFYTNREDYVATESPRHSIATHMPEELSDYDYGSAESTEGSTLLGNSRELDLGLKNEKSRITHLQEEISTCNYYDYADSTESSRSAEESSRDYSTENSSPIEYTQYNQRGDEELVRKTISSYSHRIADQKLATDEYYDNNKPLVSEFPNSHREKNVKTNLHEGEIIRTDFQTDYRNSDEDVNTFGARDYGRINSEENPLPEMNSGINSPDKSAPNKKLGIENYMAQSTTLNSRPDDSVDQNEFVLEQPDEADDVNYSNLPDGDSGKHEADTVRYYNSIQSQRGSTVTATEDDKVSEYYSTQETQNTDNLDSRSSEAHNDSYPENRSEDNLAQGDESEEKSGVINNVEFVSGSQSIGCCTKPPEVEDDAGYMGRLKPKKIDADIKSLGDLVDSDLYYIGDGVKLPLTIKKLKDGSFALSISDKICEKRSREKCPCCVPREGRILQEKRSEKNAEESVGKTDDSSLRRRAIPDDEASEVAGMKLDDGKMLNHKRRAARSISMPVDEFAEKYNLILNLNDDLATSITAGSSQMSNAIRRDDVRDGTQEDNSDLVQKLVSINDVPENERAEILLSTLQELIQTEPKEVVNGIKKKLRGIKSADDDRMEDESGAQGARYGYQRDNPILDRIKIIKQFQNKANRCKHRYQKDCDDAITQKTELLTMILYWLKDLVTNEGT